MIIIKLNFQSSDSTNQDYFARPMGILFDAVRGSNPNTGTICNGPMSPLSMNMLDFDSSRKNEVKMFYIEL